MENQPLSESKSDSAGQSEIDLRGESVSHLQDESVSESQNDSWNESPGANASAVPTSFLCSASRYDSNSGRSGDNRETAAGDVGSDALSFETSDARCDVTSFELSNGRCHEVRF